MTSIIATSIQRQPGASSGNVRRGAFTYFLAILLLLAAWSKAYEARHEDAGVMFLWTQVALESALGLWLISGWSYRRAWRIALTAFAGFAVVSLIKIFRGDVSCGCFGAVHIPPLFTYLLDLAIVIFLLAGQPRPAVLRRGIRRRWMTPICIMIPGISAGLVAARLHPTASTLQANIASRSVLLGNKSPPPTKADFIAIAVSRTEWVANLDSVTSGAVVAMDYPLKSPVSHAVAIRGVSASCGCTDLPNPPKVISSSATTNVRVYFHAPLHLTNFDSDVRLTTDDPHLPPLILRIVGRVEE